MQLIGSFTVGVINVDELMDLNNECARDTGRLNRVIGLVEELDLSDYTEAEQEYFKARSFNEDDNYYIWDSEESDHQLISTCFIDELVLDVVTLAEYATNVNYFNLDY